MGKRKTADNPRKAKKLNAVLLYGDEVSFALWGSLSKTWGPQGKQTKVTTKGNRKGLKGRPDPEEYTTKAKSSEIFFS